MRNNFKILKFGLLLCTILFFSSARVAEENAEQVGRDIILVFKIKKDISKPAWRITQDAFEEATRIGAKCMILHFNTYGGMVNIADSIRTKIINSEIPVYVFIDNQAISAGALISIACDSIYMRPGGSIGAATVVNQSGEVVPDKYQSFMRSTMRATAESHGKDTIIIGNDTIYKWHRDPKIAEAMVDPRIKVEGIIDSGQVLTLTAEEAMKVGYCEGMAKNINEVIGNLGMQEYEVYYYEPKGIDKMIGFLLNPILQGILIILIVAGIYMELQTPGIGFPLGIAIVAALFYFAPLYLEGMAQHWELIVFIVGLILIALEVFVIPGFGVAGILGILMVLTGLTLSLVDNVVFEIDSARGFRLLLKSLLHVVISILLAFIVALYISRKVGTSRLFASWGLEKVQDQADGYISIDKHQKEMIGKIGVAKTVLRPSGRILIEGELFDAKSEIGYIEKGEKVRVLRDEAGQLYVIKA